MQSFLQPLEPLVSGFERLPPPPPLRYMTAHHVPAPLQRQSQAHLKLHFDTARVRDEVLRHVPASIRMRILKHNYSHFLSEPYLFFGTSDIFKVGSFIGAGLPWFDWVEEGGRFVRLRDAGSGWVGWRKETAIGPEERAPFDWTALTGQEEQAGVSIVVGDLAGLRLV
jgi:hypothetical protein